jgi:hypothetical protein
MCGTRAILWGMTTPKARPGRKPKYAPTEWSHFSMQVPRELARAWARYHAERGGQRTELVMAHLEQVLVRAGYLRVMSELDPASGLELRSYRAVEGR